MSLAVTRTVVIGEGSDSPLAVTVRELTVAEIRTWLKEIGDGSAGVDAIDVLLLKDVSLQDLMRLSSLTQEQVDGLTPSQLRRVLDEAREINADFFVLRAGLVMMSATLRESSSAPSAV